MGHAVLARHSSRSRGLLVARRVAASTKTSSRPPAWPPPAHRCRLDPPLLLALDGSETSHRCRLCRTLMAEGGQLGITTMPVLQSLSHGLGTDGVEHQAGAIWDASIVKIIPAAHQQPRPAGPGALIGERDEYTDSTLGDHGTPLPTKLRPPRPRSSRRPYPTPPSAPASCCCAPPSSPTCTPGPPGPTPGSSPAIATNSKHCCAAVPADSGKVTWARKCTCLDTADHGWSPEQ